MSRMSLMYESYLSHMSHVSRMIYDHARHATNENIEDALCMMRQDTLNNTHYTMHDETRHTKQHTLQMRIQDTLQISGVVERL
jgi:hypothetical protein